MMEEEEDVIMEEDLTIMEEDMMVMEIRGANATMVVILIVIIQKDDITIIVTGMKTNASTKTSRLKKSVLIIVLE